MSSVYGVSWLRCLRLHNEVYGQDNGRTRWLQHTKIDAHTKKVDCGHSKHLGQAVLWDRNICSWEFTLYETV